MTAPIWCRACKNPEFKHISYRQPEHFDASGTRRVGTEIELSTLRTFAVSKDTIWRWRREGEFPKPVKLGKKITRWRLNDIEDWEATCPFGFVTSLPIGSFDHVMSNKGTHAQPLLPVQDRLNDVGREQGQNSDTVRASLNHPAHWDALHAGRQQSLDIAAHALARQAGFDHRGMQLARHHRVHPETARGIFHRHNAAELDHARLGGRIDLSSKPTAPLV
jgi:prophage regulatory protein